MITNMKIASQAALALGLGLASATGALAQVITRAPTEKAAYFGFGGGVTMADVDCAGSQSCDDQDAGWKGYAGYMFTPNLGVEVSGADLGSFIGVFDIGGSRVDVSFRPSAYAVYGLAGLPMKYAMPFAKVGAAYVESRVSSTLGGNARGYKTSVAFGAGVNVRLMEGLGLRGEWERFKAEFQGNEGDVDLLSLSLLFRF